MWYFFSLKIQIRLIETIVYYKDFYSVWKETTHESSKVVAPKNLYSSVYGNATCFDEFFFLW